MNIRTELRGAVSPKDRITLDMLYRTITPDQRGALERAIASLLSQPTKGDRPA